MENFLRAWPPIIGEDARRFYEYLEANKKKKKDPAILERVRRNGALFRKMLKESEERSKQSV